MNDLWPPRRFMQGFGLVVLSAVQLILMGLIALSLLDLVYLLVRGIGSEMLSIGTVGALQDAMQSGFSGVLLILIGLELLETVRAYLEDHRIRVEVVLIVAVIALGRHIVEFEPDAQSGATLIGIAALMLALTGGYFLIRLQPYKRDPARTTKTSAVHEENRQ
jgi:uncharacterized membrane protein (DUF373 family)